MGHITLRYCRFCSTAMSLRIVFFFLASFFAWTIFGGSPVRINEFVASNSKGLQDDDGDFSDWIEIYNSGAEAVTLDEWFLTDTPSDLAKWEFPTTTLPAGGYLVVFASGKNRNSPRLHTNFNLDQTGEYLALVNREGVVVSEFTPAYPGQREDVSYGYDNSGNLLFFSVPTPGAANGGGEIDFVKDTKFSVNRGFYDTPFDLVITTGTPGATIRYTTDGIAPTETSGIVYSGPIRIVGTTTVRAAAYKSGAQPSNVDTQTYIFLDDVIHQSANGAPPPGWPSSWGGNTVDYGMDPEVVNDTRYKNTIKNDLKSLPSFSIVMKLDDLFNSTTGIYANPGQDGATWEKPCSLELIYPDGTKGFQSNAGIRIRGGFSRSTSNPKHAFRFFFNQQYGSGKLSYPLFGPSGADSFDKFDLRTFQNYSWSFQGDGNGVFLRDQFSRDTQLAMGHQAERGDFYHLYINGQYWGLYNTDERPEAAYAASYFGGNREDYDTVKVAADNSYTIYATDGNMTAWTTLYNLAKAGLSTDAAYQKILGNNPDGTPNPNYPVLIDLPNLIDYMLVIIYTGNKDAPISDFLGNQSPNNWFGVRNRNIEARMGFQFFAHDSEHTLLPFELDRDRTGPFPAGDSAVNKSSPQYIWKQMTENAEFRLKVADHIQKHFFNGGLLTPQANTARFLKRKAEIDRAVVGESARWGDAKVARPMTRDDSWIPAINAVVKNYFPTRSDIVLEQLRGDGLYPDVVAPSLNQQGGAVNPGFTLTMSAPTGTIFYTLDGTDPRLMGGNVSSKAIRYSAAISLNQNATVKVRVLSGGNWSALNEAEFTIIRTFKDLLITELMYNPAPDANADGDEFEFIELKNIGSQTLDLSGIRFTNGIEYIFPNGTQLPAGDFYVLVANPTNFAARYPGVRIDGVYTSNLSNSGEAIALIHAAGTPIAQFTYSDKAPWPTAPDGTGFSLVPTRLASEFDYNNPANWRASSRIGGSPGVDDPPLDLPVVVINEVLTHTSLPTLDAIELFNPNAAPADISGWFLSDDLKTPTKFHIPNGTIIPAGGYTVFSESDFNKIPGADPSFSLSSRGESVYLSSATLDGTLTGYSQGFQFGAAELGVSFGRYTNSVGEILYPALKDITLRAANSGPRVGPIVINEIQYDPTVAGDEFIELKNITANAIPLYDPSHPANTWRIDGVAFRFPTNVIIPPNGIIIVSGAEPELFRSHAKLPPEIAIYGPFTGNLQDNGELIELLRPDSPEADPDGSVFVPYILVDSVRYSSRSPWPQNSAGTGSSIERLVASNFGNDPANWRSSPGPASPGLENDGNRLPVVNAGADLQIVSASFPASTNIAGFSTDDGLPNPPHTLLYKWSQVSGPSVVQFQPDNRTNISAAFPGVGAYLLRLTVSDGQYTVSDDVSVLVSRPLANSALVPRNSVWKYLDNGSDQGTAWRAVDFTDTGWKSGAALLGYGDPQATIISFGPNSNAKFPTTYFRHGFNVSGAKSIVGLTVHLLRDDGAVVYLNDVEIFRSNMPQGDVNFLTWASNTIGGGDETTYFDYIVDPTLLRDGKNVLAVEVHQANGTSSDLSFDLGLDAVVNPSNQAPTANAGPDLSVELPNPASLNAVAADDGLPNPPGVFNVSWSVVNGPGSVNFANSHSPQTTATFSTGGIYLLRFTVTDGELSASDDVQVTVNGSDPYQVWRFVNFTAAELANATISGDNADPDGDSFTNKQEYIAGTNPKDGASYLRVAETTTSGSDFVLRFQAVGDKSYTIQGRDRFGADTWERIIDLSPQGTTKPIDVLDAMNAPGKRFYRVVTPQETPQ
jgi:hypothetical protein